MPVKSQTRDCRFITQTQDLSILKDLLLILKMEYELCRRQNQLLKEELATYRQMPNSVRAQRKKR